MSTASAPKTAHITGWDRAVVIALGGAGCALSYDALQQMAVAIHVRGLLTYLFPLVIDGFIAYGIRALLVLRDAPLRARLYVWALFGTATAASIWANALHAVRLNEEAASTTGLRLGDMVVAVLSTIAPLALAGAVHLYILIARGPAKGSDREDLGQVGHPGQADRPEGITVTRTDRVGQQPQAGQVATGQPVSALTDQPRLSLDKQTTSPRSLTGDSALADSSTPVTGHHKQPQEAADQPGQSDTAPPATDRPAGTEPVTGHPNSHAPVTDRPVTPPPVTDQDTRTTSDRRSDPDTEELLKIARSAVRAEDKLTRKVVAQAIRGQKIPLSSDTLTALMAQLREQHGQPVTTARN
ncbi:MULTISPECIES: DUF2637 domain-containing protein [Streptomycetaceae]|uniref:DUF2637 domain-containing protein n=1 Tax=Streptantibioticus cattleyicolor (strain ATCC 35852 / DSM 46488 / JCM 4925 / NBRC 14057 / NRRL 8057) TaxID=1003195 RepID=F8K4K8_STREN|nr:MULTISPECIES: DUF2637 domain-containing protein [Streptomycetaceae]AEW95164.1 hypothetical protein SCATT_27930 [Streptantibioticus cattleyicolor NRRL 8057 = DSM 46488]MYS59749.1 DUF2637 domain-containing protein [Streptomyces sp. SID5468]CCB75513.1 conserved membrane protein of unknown function [Streptantibioticus cattleyicolor NRRL 8057 = DSM 46488]